jgi:hypothetical protein
MEPRKQELEQTQQPRPEEKRRRFRLVKLEERIAPRGGGYATHPGMPCTHSRSTPA